MKIKIKSLAAEATIIRKDFFKANDPDTRNSLYLHRIFKVRPEARASLLAYAYLRGKTYASQERPGSRPPDWKNVLKIARRFGWPEIAEVDIELWANPPSADPAADVALRTGT